MQDASLSAGGDSSKHAASVVSVSTSQTNVVVNIDSETTSQAAANYPFRTGQLNSIGMN